MKRLLLAAALALVPALAAAQSNPGLSYGQVPTAGQLNSYFSAKQDLLRYTPLNRAGDTMMGKLQTSPSTINGTGFAILPGIAPTSPSNGDVWVTAAGFYARVNNQTLRFGDAGSFLAVANNLSDVASTSTARTNLGAAASGANTDITSLNSPALGSPTMTTQATTDNSTKGASTAYVKNVFATIPAATVLPIGQVRLTYTSSTTLIAKPYNGNLLMVNGAYQTVPSSGFTCSNTGLTAATLYYAYAYVSGSTLACEVVTTTHATSTTTGAEIKSGDGTRTLIGMVYTGSGTPGTFVDSATQRYVATWFNRYSRSLIVGTGAPSGSISTTSTAQVELSTSLRTSFVAFADSAVDAEVSGYASNNTAGYYSALQVGLDTTASGNLSASTSAAAGQPNAVTSRATGLLSEGQHYATALTYVQGGASQFYLSVIARID